MFKKIFKSFSKNKSQNSGSTNSPDQAKIMYLGCTKDQLNQQREYLKQRIYRIDEEIIRIQRSTKTTFAFAARLHDHLRLRYRWYYNWHLNKYANSIHIIISILFALLSFYIIFAFWTSPSKADGSITLTSQADWEAGTLVNIDSATTPGSIEMDNKTGIVQDLTGATAYASDPHTGDPNSLLQSGCTGSLELSGDPGDDWWYVDLGEVKESVYFEMFSDSVVSDQEYFTSNNGVDWTSLSAGIDLPATCGMAKDRSYNFSARYVKMEVLDIGEPTSFSMFTLYKPYAVHTSAATQLDGGVNFSAWTLLQSDFDIVLDSQINVRFRTSHNATDWTAWSESTHIRPNMDTEMEALDQRRYLQVEATLRRGPYVQGQSTPTLNSYTANYITGDSPAETCSDGIQNQDETGVDCGGVCPACVPDPTCSDGLQNGTETGVDCGGSCAVCSGSESQPTTDTCTNFDHIVISPTSLALGISQSAIIAAYAANSIGQEISTILVTLTTNGGTLNNGRYISPGTPGNYTLSATSACGNRSINVLVSTQGSGDDGIDIGSGGNTDSADSEAGDGDKTGCVGDSCLPPDIACVGPYCMSIISIVEISPTASRATLLTAVFLASLILILEVLAKTLTMIKPNQLLALLIKGRDRKRAKGLVYDASSGLGVPLVVVMLFRAKDQKLIKTATSGSDGKFALETPAGEEYYIEIKKDGFSLLNKAGSKTFSESLAYENNYFGDNFRPSENQTVFEQVIPLSLTKDSNQLFSSSRALERLNKVLRILNVPLILFGFLMSILATVQTGSTYNYIVISIYLLIFIYYLIRLFIINGRSYGTVIAKTDNSPIDLAVVRAISETSGKLTKTTVTDKLGRFTLIVPKGFYKLIATKVGLQEDNTHNIRINSSFEPKAERILMKESGASNDFSFGLSEIKSSSAPE